MNSSSKAIDQCGRTEDFVESLYDLARQYLSAFKESLVRSQREERTAEISISGTQLLLAMSFVIGSVGPLVWLFEKYWLFAV